MSWYYFSREREEWKNNRFLGIDHSVTSVHDIYFVEHVYEKKIKNKKIKIQTVTILLVQRVDWLLFGTL
jgi:hypothetical protein